MIVRQNQLAFALGAIVAIAVPFAVLWFANDAARAAVGLSVPGFGWPRVLFTHLLFAIPLGYVIALSLRTHFQCKIPPAASVASGFAVLAIVAWIAEPVASAMVSAGIGQLATAVLRSCVAVVLVLPWCAACATQDQLPAPTRLAVILAAVCAILPPALESHSVIEARTPYASELLESGRTAKATMVLTGLCELGSETAIAGKSPHEWLAKTHKELKTLRDTCDQALPANATPNAKLNRATSLLALNRLTEATDLLTPLAERDPFAALLLATVLRDREQWNASNEQLNSAVERFREPSKRNPRARAMCVSAFEMLARNAHDAGQPHEAEAALTRGLAEFPTEAARFHFLLAQHYRDGGKPERALDHLQQVMKLEPAKYEARVREMDRGLRTHTHGCVLPSLSW